MWLVSRGVSCRGSHHSLTMYMGVARAPVTTWESLTLQPRNVSCGKSGSFSGSDSGQQVVQPSTFEWGRGRAFGRAVV